MRLLNMIYKPLHRLFSRPSERGEHSSGFWQDKVRGSALELCRGTNGKVLEVGCGEGLFVSRLKQQEPGVGVWGVDINSELLQEAAKRVREKGLTVGLSLGEAGKLDFPDGYFDAVVCVNVFLLLDSFGTVRATLNEMKRVCRSGGKIIFDFRNSHNLLLRAKYALAPYYDDTLRGQPLRTYTPVQVSRLLEECGFRQGRWLYLGAYPKKLSPVVVVEAIK